MATKTIQFTHSVDGTLTALTSAKLSDPTGAFGVRRQDTQEVVVADGTDFENPSTGVYEYTLTDLVAGVVYEYWIETVYAGATDHDERTFTAPGATDDDADFVKLNLPDGVTFSRNGVTQTVDAAVDAALAEYADKSTPKYWALAALWLRVLTATPRGVKSESLDGHSVTYDDAFSGWAYWRDLALADESGETPGTFQSVPATFDDNRNYDPDEWAFPTE